VYRPADGGAYPVLLSRQAYNKDVNINVLLHHPVGATTRLARNLVVIEPTSAQRSHRLQD
jgi:hypothetical protein